MSEAPKPGPSQEAPKRSLRVLYLEDNPNDLLLVRTSMRQSGVPVELLHVSSAQDYASAIEAGNFDLILSDNGLPGFSGSAALELARARHPQTPFVFVSGADEAEDAVRSLKAGATDYVPKDHLWRLAVIARHIAKSEVARAQWRREKQAMERRVEQLTEQLAEANRELASFSYSVSHDLRAPLQHVTGFATLLKEDSASTLSAEANECVDRILNGTQQMRQLIDDLLRLAKISRLELKSEAVSLSEIAGRVARESQAREPERRVEFRIEEGMEARGDRGLLEVALENLIQNAWKYTSRQQQALIEVGWLSTAQGKAYFVRDNGVGFRMKYADQLFAPFRRLHPPEDFPGHGIGLASVRRIIHLHGGRVWAEAEPEKGATFYFTLAAS